MLQLFETKASGEGYRLQYMELFNWGTFHQRVYRIEPEGNNSLLTGANASGKSTFIDALLTLMVPLRRQRFYNQSSGVERRGDRTEETYVRGYFGNTQREGEMSTRTQMLRDKDTYSVVLATFANEHQRQSIVTLFQVFWYTGGGLKKQFGIAHRPLSIDRDFGEFDADYGWKRRLDRTYNRGQQKKVIEFFANPGGYDTRLRRLFGMASPKASVLFNKVVGVKVLDDLSEFIREHMLEACDAEAEYQKLRTNFLNLTEAKTNIEKVGEQIRQLEPIEKSLRERENRTTELQLRERHRELGVHWFAWRAVTLIDEELRTEAAELARMNGVLNRLQDERENLESEQQRLSNAIATDNVGNQIQRLREDVRRAREAVRERQRRRKQYHQLAARLELPVDPTEEAFLKNRETARARETEQRAYAEQLREGRLRLSTQRAELEREVGELKERIEALQRSKSNLPRQQLSIRAGLLEHLQLPERSTELPYVGELIRVSEAATDWRPAIERTLRSFALQLLVPERYYRDANRYFDRTHLRGRIVYQRYPDDQKPQRYEEPGPTSLFQKLEFKPRSPFREWVQSNVARRYDYACVEDLRTFQNYHERALTKQGLTKHRHGRHEKDNRRRLDDRSNFVLGWDNREKIELLRARVTELKTTIREISEQVQRYERDLKSTEQLVASYRDLHHQFDEYERKLRN